MIRLIITATVLSLIIGGAAQAQSPLKSFSYQSSGCDRGFMVFNGDNFMLQPGNPPGAGQFPPGNFWIEGVSLTFTSTNQNEVAVIGHSGPNGDLISPFVLSGQTKTVMFQNPVLFTAGEYLDNHVVGGCGNNEASFMVVWYQ